MINSNKQNYYKKIYFIIKINWNNQRYIQKIFNKKINYNKMKIINCTS